jgi:hypothetical protein
MRRRWLLSSGKLAVNDLEAKHDPRSRDRRDLMFLCHRTVDFIGLIALRSNVVSFSQNDKRVAAKQSRGHGHADT